MATYYALPTLADLGGTVGWSLTSGGAEAGAAPGSVDDVIFDVNSGPARSIPGQGATFGTLTAVSSSAISLTGRVAFKQSINVPSLARIETVHCYPSNSTSTSTAIFGNCAIGTLATDWPSTGGTLRLDAKLTCTTLIVGPSLLDSAVNVHTFNSNGNEVTCANISATSSHGNNLVIDFGATPSTWNLIGTGAVLDLVNISGKQNLQQVTFKITDASASQKTVRQIGGGTVGCNIWNAATGGGGLNVYGENNSTVFNLRLAAGSITRLGGGGSTHLYSVVADQGIAPTVTSISGTGALGSSGATPTVITGCRLSNLYVSVGTVIANNCLNQGGLSGWRFQNSRFAQFF